LNVSLDTLEIIRETIFPANQLTEAKQPALNTSV